MASAWAQEQANLIRYQQLIRCQQRESLSCVGSRLSEVISAQLNKQRPVCIPVRREPSKNLTLMAPFSDVTCFSQLNMLSGRFGGYCDDVPSALPRATFRTIFAVVARGDVDTSTGEAVVDCASLEVNMGPYWVPARALLREALHNIERQYARVVAPPRACHVNDESC